MKRFPYFSIPSTVENQPIRTKEEFPRIQDPETVVKYTPGITPGAGNYSQSYTVPPGEVWKVISFTNYVYYNSVLNNQHVRFEMTTNQAVGNTIWTLYGQPYNATEKQIIATWGPSLGFQNEIVIPSLLRCQQYSIPDVLLFPGFNVNWVFQNLQATDVISWQYLSYLKWTVV